VRAENQRSRIVSDYPLSTRTITLGRVGSFSANDLIGQPYGLAYEIVDKRLKVMPPRTLQEIGTTQYLQLGSWNRRYLQRILTLRTN
jgi:Gcd10p family